MAPHDLRGGAQRLRNLAQSGDSRLTMEFLYVLCLFFLLSYRGTSRVAGPHSLQNESIMNAETNAIPIKLARLLKSSVEGCGRSQSEIARRAGLKRDRLRRSMSGEREATLSEALAILQACGNPSARMLVFLLLTGEEFALTYARSGLGDFLDEFLRLVPLEIAESLASDSEELRPRWARGTAKLLARTLHHHVAELSRRGDAIGEQFIAGSRI